MAEGASDLDAFFNKRDKKKSKSKSAVTSADLESGMTRKKKSRPKIDNPRSSGEEKREEGAVPQDEEWNDYEEEKEADLTGLRIQNMQLAGKREEEENKEDQEEEGEEGEDTDKPDQKETSSGPWNKLGATAQAPVMVQAAPEPAPEPKAEEPKSTGKYIPPSLRGGSSAATKPISSKRAKKTAPDMTSVEDFPTLGNQPVAQMRTAGSPYGQDNDGTSHVFQRKGPELTLENKYSALQE